MKAYLVFEDYWHDIDGASKSFIEGYVEKADADECADRLNKVDGYQGEYFARTYIVEEIDLK